MPPVGFERTISAGERPQTYALDRAAGHWDRFVTFILVLNRFLLVGFLKSFECLIVQYLVLNVYIADVMHWDVIRQTLITLTSCIYDL
jgi:hypothetical protein